MATLENRTPTIIGNIAPVDVFKALRPHRPRIDHTREHLRDEIAYCMGIGLLTSVPAAREMLSQRYDPKLHAAWRNTIGILEQRAHNLRILGRVLAPALCPPDWFEKLKEAVHEVDLVVQTRKQRMLYEAAFSSPGPDVGNELYKPLPADVIAELRAAEDWLMKRLGSGD